MRYTLEAQGCFTPAEFQNIDGLILCCPVAEGPLLFQPFTTTRVGISDDLRRWAKTGGNHAVEMFLGDRQNNRRIKLVEVQLLRYVRKTKGATDVEMFIFLPERWEVLT